MTTPALPAPAVPSAPASPPRWEWLWLGLIGLGLGGLALVAYSNSFTAGLVLDNHIMIAVDSRIRAWNAENLRLIFTRDYWWPFYASTLYRPLTTLSYLFNYAVLGNGEKVMGYHVVNFLLHWANVWLAFIILRRLSGRLAVAALAAALFAVHPVNVEAVTNIVGRADLLQSLSILFGGWCYLRAAAVGGWRRMLWLLTMGVSACLGVLAKENGLMICVFVLLYDWLWRWPLLPGEVFGPKLAEAVKEFSLKGYVALAPAVVLVVGAHFLLVFHSPVFGEIFVDNPIAYAPRFQGTMTAMLVLGRYLGLLAFPVTLSSDYSYNQIPVYGTGGGWDTFQAWAALVFIAGLLVWAVRVRRTQPLCTWGVFFFFGMQLMTSNLLLPIGSIMAERFMYLPSVGFCALAAQFLLWVGQKLAEVLSPGAPQRRWGIALATLAVAALAARTHARNGDWQNDLSLWRSAVAAAPNSFKTHKGLANALWSENPGEPALDAAIARSLIALDILDHTPLTGIERDNTLYQDLGMFYRAKGEFLEHRGEPAEAQAYFQRSLDVLKRAQEVDEAVNRYSREASLARGRPTAEIADVGNYRLYSQLGQTYVKLGDMRGAEEVGRWAEHISPEQPIGYMLTGIACFNTGRPQLAARQFAEALFLDPGNNEAWANLNRCFATLGVNPSPVLSNGPSFGLDPNNPVTTQLITEASVELVRNFTAAKQLDSVRQVRDLAVSGYHVPPQAFAEFGL